MYNNRRNNRFSIFIAAIIVSLLVLLTGCASTKKETDLAKPVAEDSSNPVTLTVYLTAHYANPDTHCPIYEKLLDYQKENPNITIQFVSPKEGDTAEREAEIHQLNTEILSGKGPDLFIMEGNRLTNVNLFPDIEKSMMNGAFLDLTDVMDSNEFTAENFYMPLLDAGKLKGKQYIFVNAVYLYDEKALITFNYKDGTKTITFDEIAAKDAPEGNGSDLGCFAPPRERLCRNTRAFFFCTNSKLTQAGGFEQGGGAKHRKQQPSGLLFSPRMLEFRNVYRDSGTCRNKVRRAWCSWRNKKLFVSENKSAPGCSSLEEELSGGCYWMHFIFAGAFSSGHCSRMFPAFCPGPDTRRGCKRSVWLCRGRAFRSRPAGSRPHHRRRPAPKTDHGCPAG